MKKIHLHEKETLINKVQKEKSSLKYKYQKESQSIECKTKHNFMELEK